MPFKMDGKILDKITEAIPNIYKDVELGMLLHDYCVVRKKEKLPITKKYIIWLSEEFKSKGHKKGQRKLI